MADRYPSIYQRARKDACLTQEQAAELLSVSVETVKAWEQRQRVPRPEDVERMQAAYGTPWLGLEYTRATCGQLGVLPELRLQGLPTAVLGLINRATALADDYRRLMLIAEDGIIDEIEAPEFDRIAQSIQDVIAAGYEVLYAEAPPGIKKSPPCGWHHRADGSGLCSRERLQDYCITFRPDCKPQFYRGGGDLSVITWGFVLIGICTLTSGLFRLVDRIEGRR